MCILRKMQACMPYEHRYDRQFEETRKRYRMYSLLRMCKGLSEERLIEVLIDHAMHVLFCKSSPLITLKVMYKICKFLHCLKKFWSGFSLSAGNHFCFGDNDCRKIPGNLVGVFDVGFIRLFDQCEKLIYQKICTFFSCIKFSRLYRAELMKYMCCID